MKISKNIKVIKAMEYTNGSTWPEDHVKLYLTNDMKDRQDMASISRLIDQDAGKIVYILFMQLIQKEILRLEQCK